MADNSRLTQEDSVNVDLWGYLTTFWDHLKDDDREVFENYWGGLRHAADSMVSDATRFYMATAPEFSEEAPVDNYYEILLGPMSSKPLPLDPTGNDKNYTIRPIEKILVEPEYTTDLEPTYNDMIKISAGDYYKIRNTGLGCYVIVKVDSSRFDDKYFKVANLISSEEAVDTKQYAEVTYEQHADITYDAVADNTIPIGEIGTLALEGLKFPDEIGYVDISNNRVQIVRGAVLSVKWSPNYLLITLAPYVEGLITSEISSIIAATPTGTPWATLKNKSGRSPSVSTNKKDRAPLFSNGLSTPGVPDGFSIKFKNLSNYRAAEIGGDRYYPPGGMIWKWYEGYGIKFGDVVGTADTGEYVNNNSKNNYFIVVSGNLSYLENETFSIYLTTGRAYDVDSRIIDIPNLHTYITAGYPIEFSKDSDYTFYDSIVEFNHDIFDTGEVIIGDTVYCKSTPSMEDYLYSSFGNLIGIPDWVPYGHDNYSGKTAISSAVKSIQNISNIKDYNRAMNVYYGQPIAPKKSQIVGLYESYGYKIIGISGNDITLEINHGTQLHDFVAVNGELLVEGKGEFVVTVIIDRTAGSITVDDDGISSVASLAIGDRAYVKLRNKYPILSIYQSSDIGYPVVNISCNMGSGPISHVVDTVSALSVGDTDLKPHKYSEFIIYGTENLQTNYNGTYHAVGAENHATETNVVSVYLYKRDSNSEPIYNDYIGIDTPEMPENIFAHLPWPTHKFLYLRMDNGEYYKAYIDAPIDTIYDTGDVVEQYQVLTRNVSVLTKQMFPNWNEFDVFHKYSGVALESDFVEITKAMTYAKFGSYFPSNNDLNVPNDERPVSLRMMNRLSGGIDLRLNDTVDQIFERSPSDSYDDLQVTND